MTLGRLPRRCAGLAALGAAVGCLDRPAVREPEPPLTFVREVFADSQPAPPVCVLEDRCSWVRWDVPRARGGIAALRASLDAVVDALLVEALRPAVDDTVRGGPRALAAAFLAGQRAQEARVGYPAPWWFDARGTIALQSDSLVTVAFTFEAFAGGAHPYGGVRLRTLRRATGDPVARWELFPDTVALAAVVERFFRRARDLADDADLAAAGFDFDGGFRLPAELAVTRDGLRARYDAYEVGPYALGPTDVLVPLDSVRALLAPAAVAPHRP